jgi:hypothetical protein
MSVNFAFHFNKADLTEANLCKMEKKTFLTSSMLGMKWSGRPQKYVDVSTC